MLAIGIPVILAIVFGALFFGYERGQEALEARTKAVQITNRHAIRAPEGDFRRSLLLVIANLDAVAKPTGIYERIIHGNEPVRAEALAALRDVLRRSPWLAGRYGAAGLDPAGRRMALLAQDQSALFVLALPAESGGSQVPKPKSYVLPAQPATVSMIRPAAGFLSGLGPAALVNGYLYFWDERGARQECNIEAHLPPAVAAGSWIRAEFVAGRLQLSTNERHGAVSNLRVLRLDAADLRGCSDAIAAAETVRLPQRASSQPVPVFADRADGPQLLEYLEETAGRPPNELAANLPVDPSRGDARTLVELDWIVGAADRQSAPIRSRSVRSALRAASLSACITRSLLTPPRGRQSSNSTDPTFMCTSWRTSTRASGPAILSYRRGTSPLPTIFRPRRGGCRRGGCRGFIRRWRRPSSDSTGGWPGSPPVGSGRSRAASAIRGRRVRSSTPR